MRKKVCLLLLLAMLLALALAGCRGNELPDGMDEDKVSSAGLAVMSQLTKGEYEEVLSSMISTRPFGRTSPFMERSPTIPWDP